MYTAVFIRVFDGVRWVIVGCYTAVVANQSENKSHISYCVTKRATSYTRAQFCCKMWEEQLGVKLM